MISPFVSKLTQPLVRPLVEAIGGELFGSFNPATLFADIINDAGLLAPYVTFTRSSTATYFDSNGVMQTAAANEPRYDYDPVTKVLRGLLIEEQRTNFYNSSNSFTAGTGITITASSAIGIDGTLNASRYAKTDATTPRYSNSQTTMTVAANTAYTVSRYFKYDGFDTTVSLEYNSSDNWGAVAWMAIFNVTSSGVSVSAQSACTASVENVGNGWYRARATFTTGATIATPTNPRTLVRITGASGVSVLMSYAQIEQGAFATSYIPTTTASVTRATDFASVNNLADIGFNASAGTFFNEFRTPWSGGSDPTRFLLLFNGDPNKRIMYFNGGMDLVGTYDGTTIIYSAGDATGVQSKVASAYSPTDRAICNGGGVVNTGAIAAGYTTATLVSFGGVQNICGHIRRLRYYNRRLTNAELQALTA